MKSMNIGMGDFRDSSVTPATAPVAVMTSRTDSSVAQEAHLSNREPGPKTTMPFPSVTDNSATGNSDTIHVSPLGKKRFERTPFNLNTTGDILLHEAKQVSEINELYLNVVFMDGKWTEIGCGICGKNAGYNQKAKGFKFFGQLVGTLNHIKSHFDKDTQKDVRRFTELFKHVTRRDVNQEDVDLMKAGEEPKVPITMRTEEPNKKTPTKRKTPTAHSDGMDDAESPAKKARAGSDGSLMAYRTPSYSEDDPENLPGMKLGRS